MEKQEKELVYIDVEKIHPHPNNPRKELGDIEELSESIKLKGVLQNLTVVPSKEFLGEYTAVIGHKRRAAAVKAGKMKVPCIIDTEMTEQEQFEVMMIENVQRTDLTVYEQAQGFQMMLDFGNSVDEIAEKTGFSKTTVYHRLNVAKLNQKELQKKENDSEFQLSFKDLIELEKIESVRTRNKVLKEAKDSRNLSYLAKEAAKEEKREKNKKAILKKFRDRDIKPFPENEYTWSGKWKEVKIFDLDKDDPEKVTLKKTKEQQYYKSNYGRLHIYERKIQEQTKKQEKQGLSEEEKQLRRDRKQMKAIQENLADKIEQFLNDIFYKKVERVSGDKFMDKIWKYLILSNTDIRQSKLYLFNQDEEKNWWCLSEQEVDAYREKFEENHIAYQMLITASMERIPDLYSHDLSYQKEKRVQLLIEILSLFGFSITEEEQKLLDGTLEQYRK